MTLRYPSEIGGGTGADYVQFVPVEYRANRGQGGEAGRGAPSRGQAVILYMPNSTPAVGNANSWGEATFEGPIGNFARTIASGAANMTYSGGSISSITENLTKEFQNIKKSMDPGGIARQGALQFVGSKVNATAGQLLALTRGEVYNPNVELLYKMPGMRSFDFTFAFAPKNPREAQNINRIIKEFKKWSAPADIGNGMFEVPHVWEIQYMTGGQPNENMNKFKKAACTNVTVKANPQTTMHVAHEDGVPIETVMSLNFKEVDIIIRGDHEEGNQGF